MSAQEIQTEIYEIGKQIYGESGVELRRFFRDLYLIWGAQTSGPRWGEFIKLLGVEEFKEELNRRLYKYGNWW